MAGGVKKGAVSFRFVGRNVILAIGQRFFRFSAPLCRRLRNALISRL